MLGELAGRGWVLVEPPLPDDETSVVARYDGEPIRAGFTLERVTDDEDQLHVRYRSGQYDLQVKIDFDICRGQIKVEQADGYQQ